MTDEAECTGYLDGLSKIDFLLFANKIEIAIKPSLPGDTSNLA
jgi:hypothetical protein